MCRINCSGGCPECAPDEHFKMTHWQIMKWLTEQKTLISSESTVFCLDDEECLLWKDKKNPEWHAVAGDGWASLFEDAIFYEVSQAGLLQWYKSDSDANKV